MVLGRGDGEVAGDRGGYHALREFVGKGGGQGELVRMVSFTTTVILIRRTKETDAFGSFSSVRCSTAVTWGRENRECTLRIASPPYGTKCDNVEIRAFDASANPYLGLASFVACGIDGLARKAEMPPETTGDPMLAKDAVKMPESLLEALEKLEKDEVLREMMGEQGMLFHVESRRFEVEYMSGLSFAEQVRLYAEKF